MRKWVLMLESLKLSVVIVTGFGAGLLLDPSWLPIDLLSECALILLLALIGCQMRNSGMKLRQILLNRWGLGIAAVVMLSSWGGGLLAACVLDLPWGQGLAFSSGFGWYSLSGILIGDGISFFENLDRDVALHLADVKAYKNGMVEVRYEVPGHRDDSRRAT